MTVVWAPVQAGFCGGDVANVVPPVAQEIGQAVAVMYTGGALSTNMGLGSVGLAPPEWKISVLGSMAYCQAELAFI